MQRERAVVDEAAARPGCTSGTGRGSGAGTPAGAGCGPGRGRTRGPGRCAAAGPRARSASRCARLALGEQPLGLVRAGEAPVGQRHRAALAEVERVLLEVLADQLVQPPEGQRVARAGRDVEVLRPARLRVGRAHRDQRVDHVVDRHDVDDRVRRRGQVGQLAAAVGQDDRLGHLEALDPARVRPDQRGLDDADGRTMLTGIAGAPGASTDVPAGELLDDPLAHRLGERVDVRPAQAAGALAAGLQLLLA